MPVTQEDLQTLKKTIKKTKQKKKKLSVWWINIDEQFTTWKPLIFPSPTPLLNFTSKETQDSSTKVERNNEGLNSLLNIDLTVAVQKNEWIKTNPKSRETSTTTHVGRVIDSKSIVVSVKVDIREEEEEKKNTIKIYPCVAHLPIDRSL